MLRSHSRVGSWLFSARLFSRAPALTKMGLTCLSSESAVFSAGWLCSRSVTILRVPSGQSASTRLKNRVAAALSRHFFTTMQVELVSLAPVANNRR